MNYRDNYDADTWTDRNDYDESRAEHEALRATRHDPIDPYYPHPTQETTTMSNHEAFIAQVNDALGHEPLVEPDPTPPHGSERPMTFTMNAHVLGAKITEHRYDAGTHFVTFMDDSHDQRVTLSMKHDELDTLIADLIKIERES